MPRKRSEAAGLLRFFSDEPIEKAEFVYEMVQDVMRARRAKVAEKSAGKPGQPKRRKPGKRAAAVAADYEKGATARAATGHRQPTTVIDGEPQERAYEPGEENEG